MDKHLSWYVQSSQFPWTKYTNFQLHIGGVNPKTEKSPTYITFQNEQRHHNLACNIFCLQFSSNRDDGLTSESYFMYIQILLTICSCCFIWTEWVSIFFQTAKNSNVYKRSSSFEV